MNDVFMDLTKDFVLKSGDIYTIYKPEYPEFLFKGPYLEETQEYIKLTHLISAAKDLRLKYIPVPIGIVKYYKMFKTSDENLNSRLDTIRQEFLVFIYEADIHLDITEERKIDKVPKFISQELQLEDLSKLVNLKYKYRKPQTFNDYIDNIISMYSKAKNKDDKISEILDYEVPYELLQDLTFLVLFEISIGVSSNDIYYMNLFDKDNNTASSQDIRYSQYLTGDLNSDEISEETLHDYRLDERKQRSNPKIFVDIEFESFDNYEELVRNNKFFLISDLKLEEYEVEFYDNISQYLAEIMPNLPKFLSLRCRLLIEILTNLYINWRKKYGITTVNIYNKNTISELENLKRMKFVKPIILPFYPSFNFLVESRQKYGEMVSKIITRQETCGYSGGELILNGEKSRDIIYRKEYNMTFIGPWIEGSYDFVNILNLNILSKEFDIKCLKNYSDIYLFIDGIFLSYPGTLEAENVIDLIRKSCVNKGDAIKLYSNEKFNELIFDLTKLYILGVNIDLNKIYYDGEFFGTEFKFGNNNGFLYEPLKGESPIEIVVLNEYLRLNSDLQRRVAEFNIQLDIPDIDRKIQLRKKKLISILRNPSSNPTKPVENYIGYILPRETKTGVLFYSSANVLESRGYSGDKIDKILDEFENMVINSDLDSAIIKAFEVYSFITIDKIDVVLKLYNRLLTIAMRNISPESLIVQNYITYWVVFWVRNDVKVMNFDQDDSKTIDNIFLDKRINPNRLVQMISLLCSANKSNIVTRAWRGFMAADLTKFGIEEGLPKNLTEEDYKLFRSDKRDFIFVKDLPGDDIVLMCCAIYNRLRQKNLSVFVWIKSFIRNYTNLQIDGNPAIFMLWDIFGVFLDKSILEPIRDAYLSDNRYWFISSVVLNIVLGKRDEMYNYSIFESTYSLGEGLNSLLMGECSTPISVKINNNSESGHTLIDNLYNSLPDIEKLDIDIPN